MKFLTVVLMLASLNTFAAGPSLQESVEAIGYELLTGEPIEKAKIKSVLKALSLQLDSRTWICDKGFNFSYLQDKVKSFYKHDSEGISIVLDKTDSKKSIFTVKRERGGYNEYYQFETNLALTELVGLTVTYEYSRIEETNVGTFAEPKFEDIKKIYKEESYFCEEAK